MIRASSTNPIYDLFPPKQSNYITRGKREGRPGICCSDLNRDHGGSATGDSRLDARIASYEMAAKLQLSAPEVLDISGESEATRKLYGLDEKITEDFGRELPDRAPYAGARRSFRAGVERRGQRLPAAQLGQPRRPGAGPRGDGAQAWTSLPRR